MKKNSFLNDVFQNCGFPQGFMGRVFLWGMNYSHASVSRRGLKQVDWQPEWNVLDIGCGGGASVKRLLKLCPKGKVYGIDLSEESVAFARKYNAEELDRRCFIQQGDVCSLPYEDEVFDAVTAFETVYFWSPVSKALEEVFRVIRKGGCFLITLEMGDAELGKAWEERIKGMTAYGAEDMKRLLSQAGFSDIRVIQNKEELHVVARK